MGSLFGEWRTPRGEWLVEGSIQSKKIVNPIRDIVDGRKLEQNPGKELIRLSLGLQYIAELHFTDVRSNRVATIYSQRLVSRGQTALR